MKPVSFVALVERLSSVQHERERALATQLRSALEEREKALRMVHSLENKYVRILARFAIVQEGWEWCVRKCSVYNSAHNSCCAVDISSFWHNTLPTYYQVYYQPMPFLVLYQQFNYQLL